MSLRIAHLTTGHEAYDTRIVAKQCAGISASGHKVTLIAKAPLVPDFQTPPGVEFVPVPRPVGRFDRFLNTTRKVVAAAKAQNVDIYHFHDPDLLPFMLRMARQGARVVYDVHEDYRESIGDRSWIPAPLKKPAVRAMAAMESKMGKVGWVSAATPDIAAFFDARRTVLIQNFPDLDEFHSATDAIAYDARPNSLVYVGAVTAERGVTEIVEALPEISLTVPDVRFELVGPASTDYLSRLEALPGWKHTKYHGQTARAGVVSLLTSARVGLVTLRDIPRYRAAQPTKLYEYMAAGLPVVASDFPRWRNQVGSNVGHFVPPEPEKITKAVVDLLSSPERAKEMGWVGRQAVEREFSWQADLKKLVSLYEGIMSA